MDFGIYTTVHDEFARECLTDQLDQQTADFFAERILREARRNADMMFIQSLGAEHNRREHERNVAVVAAQNRQRAVAKQLTVAKQQAKLQKLAQRNQRK